MVTNFSTIINVHIVYCSKTCNYIHNIHWNVVVADNIANLCLYDTLQLAAFVRKLCQL